MPTLEQHLRQAQKTHLQLEHTQDLGWCVTMRFYEALHLVDSVFAVQGVHPADHRERGNGVAERRYGLGFMARSAYEQLAFAAHRTRYTCPSESTLERLNEASREDLQDVRDTVKKLLERDL
jgi:hypothetical protein